MVAKAAAEFVYSGVGKGEVLQERARVTSGGAGADRRPLGALQENRLNTVGAADLGV